MKKTHDTLAEYPGLTLIHQKIAGYEKGRHEHDEHEFFLPLQGQISLSSEEGKAQAGPGRMLYMPPKVEHDFTSSTEGSGERLIWMVSAAAWKKHGGGKFAPTSMPMNSLAKELLFTLLIHKHTKGAKYFIAALHETMLQSLEAAQVEKRQLEMAPISGKVEDPRIATALEILSKDFKASLPKTAKASGLSERNFSRIFMQATGLTPKEFVVLKRIERAKELLKDPRLTVTDISLAVGYESLSKFIDMFKRMEGVLPSDFRRPV